jgi:GDP-L-fucose synthase
MRLAIKKILILGGTGFIGRSLYKSLKEKFKIFSLSKSQGNDLRKESTLKNFFINNSKIDIIINCAAHVGGINYLEKKCADVMTDNLQIYTNLYKNLIPLKNKPIIINLLSNCMYPEKLKIQIENKWQEGQMHKTVEAFGIAKRVLVIYSKNYEKQYGVISYNLILPNAFGPGDHLNPERSHALNAIIIRMLKSKEKNLKNFEVWGSGKPRREWIFVEDICQALIKIIKEKLNKGIILNIAQNRSYSINEITYRIKKILKYNGHINNNTKYADGASMKQLSNKNFKKFFKKFKFTNFNVAIKKTVAYYYKLSKNK